MTIRAFRLVLAAVVIAAAMTHRGSAQIPAEFKNLQVLPKDITRADLVMRMRNIATQLGVRCNHCHVGPDNLQGMDFATDQKRTKQVARVMLKMVQDINANYVSTVPEGSEGRQPVTCFTCHRRSLRPTRALHEILVDTAVSGGAAAALTRYQTFREEYFGSGLYDFREHTLNIVGNRLRDEQKQLADSYEIFKKNAELFPKSADAQFFAGEGARLVQKMTEAEAFYRSALAINPQHAGAAQALKAIGK